MTTFGDVIERTRRRLLTNMRPGVNIMDAPRVLREVGG